MKITIFWYVLLTAALFAKAEPPASVKAFPNPFSSAHENLTIEKQDGTPFSGTVKLTVYDFNLKKLFEREFNTPTSLRWNGHDTYGRRVRPGVYFLRLQQEKADSTYTEQFIKVLVK